MATPRDRLLVGGWRLPELKERADWTPAVWCWPRGPLKGMRVLEDSLAWLRVVASSLTHSAVTISAPLQHVSGSHQQPKQVAFPWSHHFLSPEDLSFPGSACSA